jgi:ABC-type microcin C transport system duplicated ATPase subunit YejF
VSDAAIREVRGNRIAMIFQEPMTSLNPVYTIGRQLGEPLEMHKGLGGATLLEKCVALLESVSAATAPAELSARVQRRHAAAGDDRHGHKLRSRHHRRR